MKLQNPRQVYGETLVELGRKNKDIVVLEADLGKSTMTSLFEAEFPERFFEIGIEDRFGQSAHSYDELLEEYGLTTYKILDSVRRLL